jgi:hypothetical protein
VLVPLFLSTAQAAGVWVDLEWRAMALAAHPSHGPGFAAGASLLGDHLQIGLAGFARPGPFNPATFEVAPEGGYRGRATVALRSDGGAAGLVVAPGAAVGALRIDVPVMVGYGGFGFYLSGDDRVTPDGRKPSAWEDELLDGRDSSFGLTAEAGLRAAWTTPSGVRPYLAARWTTVVGYDAFVRSTYQGPSVALGIQVAPGPAGAR